MIFWTTWRRWCCVGREVSWSCPGSGCRRGPGWRRFIGFERDCRTKEKGRLWKPPLAVSSRLRNALLQLGLDLAGLFEMVLEGRDGFAKVFPQFLVLGFL